MKMKTDLMDCSFSSSCTSKIWAKLSLFVSIDDRLNGEEVISVGFSSFLVVVVVAGVGKTPQAFLQ